MSSWFDGDSMQSFFEFQVKVTVYIPNLLFARRVIYPFAPTFRFNGGVKGLRKCVVRLSTTILSLGSHRFPTKHRVQRNDLVARTLRVAALFGPVDVSI